MNPYTAYQSSRSIGWTRIDLLLAFYEGAIERLQRAQQALQLGQSSRATIELLRVQRIVCELASSLDLQYGDVPRNLQLLYDFVLRALAPRNLEGVEAALKVLSELRDAWQQIRDEAVRMERDNQIPPLEATTNVLAQA